MVMVMATFTAPSAVVVVHDAAADADVRQVEDLDAEFFALVCSDEELLRAEFEAIVAAAWSSPPPPDPTPGRRAEPPPGRAVPSPPPASGPVRPNLVPGVRDGGDRTRSPPTITGRRLMTKGGLPPTTQEPGWPVCPVSVRSPSSA
jgi:hypothetical protein